MSKKISTRIQVKSDTTAHWNTASNASTPFIPLEGELIFITDEYEIKVGDGSHTVNELSFINKQADYNQTDETKSDFIKNKPVPTIKAEDEGKFLRVVNGAGAWTAIPSAEEASF